MAIKTTVIGSYPRYPKLLSEDFDTRWLVVPEDNLDKAWKDKSNLQQVQEEATRWAVRQQEDAGVNLITDGEQKRGNYVLYHCQHLEGIDFARKEEKVYRDGKVKSLVPVVRAPVRAKGRFLVDDYLFLRSLTRKDVKMTIPGPVTIVDSIKDAYYGNERLLALDIARAINEEVKALVKAGCTTIQLDEPVFIRDPVKFLAFGIEALQACFADVENIVKQIHICRGYPKKGVEKTQMERYAGIVEALSTAGVDGIAVEDAHEHLPLEIFRRFGTTKVILGVVDIGNPRVETVDEIRQRINEVLTVIPEDRLLVAPDCGLLLLPPEIALAKLKNMVEAAQINKHL